MAVGGAKSVLQHHQGHAGVLHQAQEVQLPVPVQTFKLQLEISHKVSLPLIRFASFPSGMWTSNQINALLGIRALKGLS